MNKRLTLYVLSDSIGETGELIARAAAKQFITESYEIRKYPFLSDEKEIKEVFAEAVPGESIIIYTTVLLNMKELIDSLGEAKNIPTIDVMSPPMKSIESILGYAPKREAGLIRRIDENYFKKVEAVEFAVKYDDGKDPRGIEKADICLIGISRTSKTPLSMYLAHKNFKVVNVPLVPEISVPDELYKKDRRRIIGLVADPKKLIEIRTERLKALGLKNSANYASVERIQKELEYSMEIMMNVNCEIIDVSSKAIEETASIIIEHMENQFGDKMF
ncbi:MAG: pyruvate, water dikinase regulatory protein [Gudongella sp.]|nr:pyruvate, water dikinase regulatory protein [Gudongella sp.]